MELKEQVNADFKRDHRLCQYGRRRDICRRCEGQQHHGVENAEAEMERIGNMIRDGIKPDLTAYTAIEKVMEGGKALIHVTVSRGLKRPYHLIDRG